MNAMMMPTKEDDNDETDDDDDDDDDGNGDERDPCNTQHMHGLMQPNYMQGQLECVTTCGVEMTMVMVVATTTMTTTIVSMNIHMDMGIGMHMFVTRYHHLTPQSGSRWTWLVLSIGCSEL